MKKGVVFWLCILNVCLLAAAGRLLAAEAFPGLPWCSVPPSAGAGVKPNLLLMLDNSASLFDLAYTDTSAYCIDDTYSNAKSYPGYFEQGTVYSYDFTAGSFKASAGTLPAGCNAVDNSYLCVGMAPAVAPATNRTANRFLASGRFLNWLAMSKLDLEKKVLTGGKYVEVVPKSGMLVAESRGCRGERYMKIASDAPQVTFAVRGPVSSDSDYLDPEHAGGLTRIEIYDRQYNAKECAKAVSDFQAGSKNLLRKDGANCLGESNWWEGKSVDGKDIPSAYKTYNDAMANCFLDPTKVFNTVIASDCYLRIYNIYHQQPDKVKQGAYDRICGKNIKHPRYLDEWGYLGEFWDGHGISGGVGAENEAREFCREAIKKAPATDPLDSANMSGNMEVPAYLLELGLLNLGTVAATLQARVVVPTAPTGVIQEFASAINMGAMAFNDTGAASECKAAEEVAYGEIPCRGVKHCVKSGVDSGRLCGSSADCDPEYSCVELPVGSDGGRVVHPVDSQVGDHASGLIAILDGIRADAWTPLAESFYNAMGYFAGRTDLRLQSGDFGATPSNYSCQKNNVLILTDGSSTADRHKAVNDLVADAVTRWGNGRGMPGSETTVIGDALPLFQGSYNLDDLAWIARNRNLADFSRVPADNKDYLSTYVVYTGPPCATRDKAGTCLGDESVAEKMMQLTALNGGGKVANAQDLEALEKALRGMMQDIVGGSGTSPAMLSTGERNGALYLQDEFHPLKSFDGGKTSAAWIGEMQALWYYIDPLLGSMTGEGSTIREDTPEQKTLKLKEDLVVNLVYDSSRNESHAYLLKDSNGDGIGDSNPAHEDRFITDQPAEVSLDDLRSLWRAGRSLWLRSSLNRTIYTQLSGELVDFTSEGLGTSSNRAGINDLLQASGEQEANDIINYVRGANISGYRSRSVVVPGVNQDHASVWKLGDIISSSPQMQSAVPLGSYHLPAPRGYGDGTYLDFIGSDSYKARGMVYVGANDGMLHAFRLGTLDPNVTGDTVARLKGESLGREEWAFVPKNALPYLKYLAHPNYRHLYYVDGGITLADVQIGSGDGSDSWRTVLIGGMGLGGASCAGGTCAADTGYVDLPSATAPDKVGYSSYFALDVTDPEKPKLLWEFSDPRLGFATAGSAILRSGGKWFAVLGSGPTGSIDTSSQQFLGRSSQPLSFFVLDLATGKLLRRIDTGIAEAFAGSLSGGGIDADKWDGKAAGNYQDDALYVGYSKRLGTAGPWSDGGVGRVATKESSTPADWVWNPLLDGIGPVTSGIARLQDRKEKNLWLFFGAGRYFFKQDDLAAPSSRRLALYGVKEPCYLKEDRLDNDTCLVLPGEKTKVMTSALVDQSGGNLKPELDPKDPGWFINLDRGSGGLGDERVLTTATASTSGAVFFSTFQPSYDPCQFGASSLWRIYYNNGLKAPDGLIKGRALVRVATGALQPLDLGSGFTQRDNRRTGGVDGKPGGIKLVTNSGLRPLKKIIHIQER